MPPRGARGGEGGRAPARRHRCRRWESSCRTRRRARRGDRRRGCGTRRPRTRRGTAGPRDGARQIGVAARGGARGDAVIVRDGGQRLARVRRRVRRLRRGLGGRGRGIDRREVQLAAGLDGHPRVVRDVLRGQRGGVRGAGGDVLGGKKLAMFAAFTGVGFLADIEVRGRSGTLLGSCAVVPHARVNAPGGVRQKPSTFQIRRASV